MSGDTPAGWGTSSGLLDDYTGTVAEVWFGTDEKLEQNPDKVFMFWRLVNIETEDEGEYDEWVERFSIGSGWEVADDGARLVRADGSAKDTFNRSTDAGRIVNRILGNNGGGKEGEKFAEAFEGAIQILAERGKQTEAHVWKGLRFHIVEHEFSSKIDGEDVEWTRNLPVAFVGVDEGLTGKSSGASDSSNSSDNGNGSGNGNGSDKAARAKLKAELKKLAKKCDSHAEFQDQAIEIDGVSDDEDLLEQVVDDSDDGLYAQANA